MTKQVTHAELEVILERAWITKEPLYIWGATGIGKSMTVKRVMQRIAKRLGLTFTEDPKIIEKEDTSGYFLHIDRKLSQMEPCDLIGIPYREDGRTKYLPPSWLPRDPNAVGDMFLDELNLAVPTIRHAGYELLLPPHKLGDYIVPKNILMIGAGNRLEDRAEVYPLSDPEKNRWSHVELAIPYYKDWVEWALTEGKIDIRIINYILKTGGSKLFILPKDVKENAFPTPRTWEKASNWIKGVESLKEVELFTGLAVGAGVASDFVAFLKLVRQVDVENIIEHPEKIKEIEATKEIDLMFSIISALVGWYRPKKEHLKKLVKVAINLKPEFCLLLLRELKMIDYPFLKRELPKTEEWEMIGKEIVKYLGDEE